LALIPERSIMLLGWMYERIRAAARGCQREQDPIVVELQVIGKQQL